MISTADPSAIANQSLAASVRVSDCVEADAWNGYVTARSSLYHRLEWERVWQIYRLPTYRLTAWRDGSVVGVLPLVHLRSALTGSQLVSLPWFDAAGVLADDVEAAAALIDAAQKLLRSVRAGCLQIRQDRSRDNIPYVRTDKVLMRLRLEPTPQALWDRLKGKVRNQVRKAEKSGLTAIFGRTELLGDFYHVYSHNMRDLGSPSHSHRLFQAVLSTFPRESRICIVRQGNVAVGAGLTIENGKTLEIPWASSVKSYNNLCVNHLLYWQILSDACRRGFEWFHFGRSTVGSGQHHFKSQWGAEVVPLHWYYLSHDPQIAADAAKPPQERFGWGTRLWQQMPLWASRRIGPWVVSGIP